jgi:hypothetical protein
LLLINQEQGKKEEGRGDEWKVKGKAKERLLQPRPNKKVRNKIGGVLDECFTHYQKTKIQGGAGVMVVFFLFYFNFFFSLFLNFKSNLLCDRLKFKSHTMVEFSLYLK